MGRHKKITADEWARMADEKRKLTEAGYVVREFTPYHWHVKKEGGDIVMNVYPSTKKCVYVGEARTSNYQNISEVIAMLDEMYDD